MAVQWLRVCLPMQGVQVRSLVGELRHHIPQGQKNKTFKKKNKTETVLLTNSKKTLKMLHIKKSSKTNKPQ